VKVGRFRIAKMLGAAETTGKGGGASAPENPRKLPLAHLITSAPEQKPIRSGVDNRADIYSWRRFLTKCSLANCRQTHRTAIGESSN